MNKRGFTLVELMGIVIILSLISLLIVAAIDRTIKVFKENAYNDQIATIKLAANDWGTDNLYRLELEDGDIITITLGQLKAEGYIEENLTNPINNELFADDMLINITKENQTFIYSVVEDSISGNTGIYNSNGPILIMNGQYVYKLYEKAIFTDEGVIATTAGGQIITNVTTVVTYDSNVVEKVDTNVVGTYIISYSATDNDITRTIFRTVVVRPIPPAITVAVTSNLSNIANGNRNFTAGGYYSTDFPQTPKIELLPKKKYTLAFNYVIDAAAINAAIGTYYVEVGYGDTSFKASIATSNYSSLVGRKTFTFTTPDTFNAAYGTPNLHIRLIANSSATAYATGNFSDIAIAYGNFTNLDYTPYAEDVATITITSDVRNLYETAKPAPTGDNGAYGSDVTKTMPGIYPDTKTWELKKTGVGNQFNGWDGNYSNLFTGNAGDTLMVSGYYKTNNSAGLTAIDNAQLFKTGYGTINQTLVDSRNNIIADDVWHPFYSMTTINEAFGNSILKSLVFPYSNISGEMLVNNISWKIIPADKASAKEIFIRKYAKGEQTVEYFKDAGYYMPTNSVQISTIGTYTFYVEDLEGNAAVEIYKVSTIEADVNPPTVTLNGNAYINHLVGTNYTDLGATALDDIDGDITSKIKVTSTLNTSVLGTYTVTYTSTDSFGNEGKATRTVNVIDITQPTVAFTPNGNTTYAKSRTVSATISDNVAVNTSSIEYQWTNSTTTPTEASFTTAYTSGTTLTTPAGVTGTYYLWILAKDTSGNTAIVRSNVFNLDNQGPTFTLAGTNPMSIDYNTNYVEPGVTANDNVFGNVSASITSSNNINKTVDGTYTVTYNAVDGLGNTSTTTRTVIVKPYDTVCPVITLSGANPFELTVGTAYVEPGYTVTDNVDPNPTKSATSISTSTSGTKTITYTATDAAGNSCTATRTVYVWTAWSAWSTTVATPTATRQVESQLQYQYRDWVATGTYQCNPYQCNCAYYCSGGCPGTHNGNSLSYDGRLNGSSCACEYWHNTGKYWYTGSTYGAGYGCGTCYNTCTSYGWGSWNGTWINTASCPAQQAGVRDYTCQTIYRYRDR